ncbi:MAG: hypothetical protein J7M26_04665 [Armatimonadetes bacterium]|nr:hypothetical protein [Armatimonadota bacterium]
MKEIDYDAHNEEVRRVWEAYWRGEPFRVPMILGISAQWSLSMPEANPEGYDFRQYMRDPEVMLRHELREQWWVRHRVPQDAEMGLPEAWTVFVDGQNVFEAGWFGGRVVLREDHPPSAEPVLTDDRKWEILDRGLPDPFDNEWARWNWDRYEYFKQKEEEGLEFEGRPVKAGDPVGLGTDGPFTVAFQLRGADALCLDLVLDPDYYHQLMDFIVEATIARMKAYYEALDRPLPNNAWGFADDAIQLVSDAMYREHILPYHRRLVNLFGPEGPNSIHLCGDATHLFRTIRDELRVQQFDTGYPVDFGWLRAELGPEVTILGGPRVDLLRKGPPQAIEQEVRRIMNSGIREGGRFILREANNVAPHTPVEHIAAMYRACKEYGRY